jgi:TIR domain/Pentapeptide repeats (8 copies)
MANPEHLAKLKEGAKAWNEWRSEDFRIMPDLSGADLSGATLIGANLQGANLTGTNLSEAHLEVANLTYAVMTNANLSGANLLWANLKRTLLHHVNFTNAKIGNTTFASVDLSCPIGLETVAHLGPSTIGIDTIYISEGEIPHIFLRGAGVPERLMEHLGSLIGGGIEFYSLFISYSTKDQYFANRLYADLQAKGIRCWFAPHDIQGGRKIYEQIDEAIRVHEKLLLILSPASMKSEWVKTEISKARKRETKEGRQVLFPIRLCSFEELRDWECFDADTGKDSAREIREYFIPDFSDWKDHDAYKLAFDRLLKDLQGKA